MGTSRTASFILFLVLGAPLAAQDAHLGIGLSLAFPTGGFNSTNYPGAGAANPASNEGYNTALGVQFTASFPVQQDLAARLDVYGQDTSGTDTSPGYASYNLEHELLSIGGEAQWFPGDGDAFRHRGAYLLGGASLDLERFTSDYGDLYYNGHSVDRTRLGGLVGFGYSFRPYRRWRQTVEVAFHKTLSGYSAPTQPATVSPGTPPADFLRVTYGFVF